MAVVLRYQDKHEVIPVVQNLAEVEKEITGLMRKMTRSRAPKLAVIKNSAGPEINKISQLIKKNVDVEELDLSAQENISDDFDALMVVGTGDHLKLDAAKKIDNFLRRGKSAAFFVDRVSIDPRTFQEQPIEDQAKSLELLALLESYGISVEEKLVADATCASLNMQENRGGFTFSLPVKYPFVPELMNLSFESPITKGLSGVILPFASQLSVEEKSGFKTEILARSSKVSWLEAAPLDLNPRRDWGKSNIEPSGPYPLIAQGRGVLPKVDAADSGDKAVESRIFVVGSSALLWDDFLSPQNQLLAVNIVDWMLADAAILEMRNRTFNDAPIDVNLSDAKRQAVKFGNIIGVPFLLVLYGLLRWRFREARRKSLRKHQ